jgi:pyruvate formate lyase activating enzyme
VDKGIIFDIKRYAVHDGPGIRTTVFFKGCPLHCLWCHNPEGIEPKPELLLNQTRCAIDCRACISECPQGAISKIGTAVYIDQEKCDLCGNCVDACLYEALLMAGEKVRVRDVFAEVDKDRIFFEESDGGVTLSGGEPLLQIEFLDKLLDAFKSRGLHVTLDTSGYFPFEDLERIWDRVDLFLYDLKMMDLRDHEEYTGVYNAVILQNLEELVSAKKEVEIRIPLVCDVNDNETNISATIRYLYDLERIRGVSLLPYHRGGCEKYIRLRKGERTRVFKPSSKDRIKQIEDNFREAGFNVKVGG